ncbi:MAG: 30S ribosomal protein S15 [Candidatus ainarchaeum sp.]|nr:30S ribosomal protein S15 [Candidatus ainarchaeum sp.]
MVKKVEKTQEISKDEIEDLIISLANAGHSPSKIGLILRDENGIKNVRDSTGKHLQQILSENKLVGEIPEDLLNLIKKSVILNKHLDKNKKDDSARRGYEMTVSKIRRLSKYYINKRKLPSNWRYTAESAALLVK